MSSKTMYAIKGRAAVINYLKAQAEASGSSQATNAINAATAGVVTLSNPTEPSNLPSYKLTKAHKDYVREYIKTDLILRGYAVDTAAKEVGLERQVERVVANLEKNGVGAPRRDTYWQFARSPTIDWADINKILEKSDRRAEEFDAQERRDAVEKKKKPSGELADLIEEMGVKRMTEEDESVEKYLDAWNNSWTMYGRVTQIEDHRYVVQEPDKVAIENCRAEAQSAADGGDQEEVGGG